MGLFDKFKKKENNPDIEDLLNLMSDAASSLAGKGCDTDEIPEGIGEFGLEITNPIPVKGIPENETYLSRLKTLDGDSITWEREGSGKADNIEDGGSPIDRYKIYNSNGDYYSTLYICPYNQKTSDKIPVGFKKYDFLK